MHRPKAPAPTTRRSKGYPIVFVHKYGADHREWEQQVRFFSRECRRITFAARGYTPSEVPSDPKLYGRHFSVADITFLEFLRGVFPQGTPDELAAYVRQ